MHGGKEGDEPSSEINPEGPLTPFLVPISEILEDATSSAKKKPAFQGNLVGIVEKQGGAERDARLPLGWRAACDQYTRYKLRRPAFIMQRGRRGWHGAKGAKGAQGTAIGLRIIPVRGPIDPARFTVDFQGVSSGLETGSRITGIAGPVMSKMDGPGREYKDVKYVERSRRSFSTFARISRRSSALLGQRAREKTPDTPSSNVRQRDRDRIQGPGIDHDRRRKRKAAEEEVRATKWPEKEGKAEGKETDGGHGSALSPTL
ncbi:hypothetical protein KM043_009196 [Ampulex compressa]|nr:hypothetical protein KM043_009196 [Ampulex compressa]